MKRDELAELRQKIDRVSTRVERIDDTIAEVVALLKYAAITLGTVMDAFLLARGVDKESDSRQSLDRLLMRIRKALPSLPDKEGE